MHVKYKIDVHNKDGQHSYGDVVVCLMVYRNGMPKMLNIRCRVRRGRHWPISWSTAATLCLLNILKYKPRQIPSTFLPIHSQSSYLISHCVTSVAETSS
jgi:hypothetical protein